MIFANLNYIGVRMTDENQEVRDTELNQTSSQEEEKKTQVIASDEDIHANDLDEHDEDDEHADVEDDQDETLNIDLLNKLNLDQLFDKARECLMNTPRDAYNKLKTIRPIFFEKYQELKKAAIEALGQDENEHFVFEKAALAEGMNQLLSTAKAAIAEEKKRIETEKHNNYLHKLKLLETLDSLVQEDETEQSIERVKEIQKEWRQIRVIPKDKIQELWDKYHTLLDKFYDNHSINIELKELDRRKNLEAKIELTKKVEEIAEEKSLKRSFILLNKYHEDFRNIGPVPQESREGIWQAFKAASDHIYEIKRAQHEALEQVREQNLKLKTLLVEKASVIAAVNYDNIKDWNAKTKEIDQLFDEWKKIGPVTRAKSDEVWSAFRKERSSFYENRKAYFGDLNKGRKENLKQKEELCKRVEALKDNEDFNSTTKEILAIQQEWKKIGPVPDKVNQAVWNRFRKACDYFFSRKEKAFEGQKDEEKANLEVKKGLIKQLEELENTDKPENEIFAQLREISATWNKTGHIPRKDFKKVSSRYESLSNTLFAKYKKNREEMKSSQWESYYSDIISSPNGFSRLKDEEYKLKKKMRALQDEITTSEQNMSLFTLSKSANNLLKDFDKRLEKNKELVERLKQEIKVIATVKRRFEKNQTDTQA